MNISVKDSYEPWIESDHNLQAPGRSAMACVASAIRERAALLHIRVPSMNPLYRFHVTPSHPPTFLSFPASAFSSTLPCPILKLPHFLLPFFRDPFTTRISGGANYSGIESSHTCSFSAPFLAGRGLAQSGKRSASYHTRNIEL